MRRSHYTGYRIMHCAPSVCRQLVPNFRGGNWEQGILLSVEYSVRSYNSKSKFGAHFRRDTYNNSYYRVTGFFSESLINALNNSQLEITRSHIHGSAVSVSITPCASAGMHSSMNYTIREKDEESSKGNPFLALNLACSVQFSSVQRFLEWPK